MCSVATSGLQLLFICDRTFYRYRTVIFVICWSCRYTRHIPNQWFVIKCYIILLAIEIFAVYLWDIELGSCLHEYLAVQSWKVSR